MSKRKIPVLILEDCNITNSMIKELEVDMPGLEIVIVTTKKEALRVLNSRNDFLIAFIDYHLEEWTSEWVIKAIHATQAWIREIFATSWNDDKRKIQICEWATRWLNKHDIMINLMNTQ